MARLPSLRYVMQQEGGQVTLFEDGSERVITGFDPANEAQVAASLDAIWASELGDEDRVFAAVWVGYFHWHAAGLATVLAREPFITEADDGTVFVMNGTAIVVSFDPSDQNAVARAQKNVYDSALSLAQKQSAHLWSGYFYGRAPQ